jgi:hypothetical protein
MSTSLRLSPSRLMRCYESPLHYYWKYELGIEEESTKAQREGQIIHKLILEKERFDSEYVTDPEVPEGFTCLRTVEDIKDVLRENKEKLGGTKPELTTRVLQIIKEQGLKMLCWDEFLADHQAGKEFISRATWDRWHLMRDRVLKHKFVARYLEVGKKEVELEHDDIFGVRMRGRIDWLVDLPELPYVICIDLKKCPSARFLRFRRTVEDDGLHIQAAVYTEMIKKIYGRDCLFVWQAIEEKAPFPTESYSANDAVIEAGEADARRCIAEIKRGLATGHWPGYSDGTVQPMDLSNYTYDRIAEQESRDEREY